MDVGASTGGFTDCMLQHGAASVLAVDTGYGQIDARLRSRPARPPAGEDQRPLSLSGAGSRARRIHLHGRFLHLRHPGAARRFISAAFADKAQNRRELVLLIKPQFEVGRDLVGKGGIVRSEPAQLAAVTKLREAVTALGGHQIEVIDSPILGTEGNREFLLHALFLRGGLPEVEYK